MVHTNIFPYNVVKLQGDRDGLAEVTKDLNQRTFRAEVTEDSDQRTSGSTEDFRPEDSNETVSHTVANTSVNTNPDLGLNFEDINDSKALEHVPERKDQANNASNEIGRTKMSRIDNDEYKAKQQIDSRH